MVLPCGVGIPIVWRFLNYKRKLLEQYVKLTNSRPVDTYLKNWVYFLYLAFSSVKWCAVIKHIYKNILNLFTIITLIVYFYSMLCTVIVVLILFYTIVKI